MNLNGEYGIRASREVVWTLITDPDVLRSSIPGCLSLDGNVSDGFAARVRVSIGPIKATFAGSVTFSAVEVPTSCTMSGQGQGGVAGFAKGEADLSLEEVDGMTTLRYEARALVGGKLAQLGGRLIEATARKLAGEFFTAFAANVAERSGTPPTGEGRQ